MTPEERAAALEVPWVKGACGHGFHGILDDEELRRRIATAIRAAVEAERAACAQICVQVAAEEVDRENQGRAKFAFEPACVAGECARRISVRSKETPRL